MSNHILLLDCNKSQSKFSANLSCEVTRNSEYLGTNFQSLKELREIKLDDADSEGKVANNHQANLEEYWSSLWSTRKRSSFNRSVITKDVPKRGLLIFLIRCTILLIAIVCESSVGIFYFYIQPQSQLLKASWRLLLLSICISPLVVMEYFKTRYSFAYSKETIWNREIWKKIVYASFGHALWTICLVISLNHTSMAQATLLISLHSMVFIALKRIINLPVIRKEMFGALLVAVGVALILFDGNIQSSEGFINLADSGFLSRNAFGNIVALLGSVGGAIYFAQNRELKSEYPFFLGVLMTSILDFVILSTLALVTGGANISFHSEYGVFGLFSTRWFGTYILFIIVTGFGAYAGYMTIAKYFQPVVLSVLPNIEPLLATGLISLLGWQSFPGVLTIIAFALIVPGTICAVLGNHEVETQEYDIMRDDASYTMQIPSVTEVEPRRVRHARTLSLLRH